MNALSSFTPTAVWRRLVPQQLNSDGQGRHARELRNRVRTQLRLLDITYNAQMVDETITLAREAYKLSQVDETGRIDACLLLAQSLRRWLNRNEDDSLLDEMIGLGREALTFSDERHPKRAQSCRNLALSLMARYQRTGKVGLLKEAIDLEREALALRPAGHSDRSWSCANLAISLMTYYERTGNVGLLDEAIDLEREALDLRPAGHTDRAVSCGNLAHSLFTRYKSTGDVGLLDEAISLAREALDLRPEGHPFRAASCGNLANSLTTRYQLTSDVRLLDEAIDLQREALELQPGRHPQRPISCGNLAGSLMTRYKRTGDVDLLNEAIRLERKALALRRTGHPDRYASCVNLALSLKKLCERTGETGLLEEAIGLEREALDLCPIGHPARPTSCVNLARSLMKLYQRTGDAGLLEENLTLLQESVTIAPVHTMWRDLHHLALTHLQRTTVCYDVSKATLYLSQSLEHDPDEPLAFVVSLSSFLDDLWTSNTDGNYVQLAPIYQRLVNLMPLILHPALGLQPQLQTLKSCTRLGSDAFVNAVLGDMWSIGLETLELAQGVVWSQSLHRRDPQLEDVPEPLASNLQHYLRAIAEGSANEFHSEDPIITARTPHDTLHINSSQAYTLLRKIRALPGLDRFMLGETGDTLRTAASDHPVVVLVGARGHYYALILAESLGKGHVILSLDLIEKDLESLSFTPGSARAHRSAATPDGTPERGDRAGLKKTEGVSSKPLDVQLRTLWHKVVKPVLAHLDLKVNSRFSSMVHACAEKKRTR
jgi:hypothetical protein